MNTALAEYQPHRPASVVHAALTHALESMEKAKQNALVWFSEVQRRRLYKELGYPSMLLYAQDGLGLSQSRAYEFLSVSERLKDLPQIEQKVHSGELAISNTIDIVKVANRENEDEWLEVGLKSSNRQLKDKIKKAKARDRVKRKDEKAGQNSLGFAEGKAPKKNRKPQPQAIVPVIERIEFTPTQYARYEKLWERIRQRGGLPSGKAAALLDLMESWLEDGGAENARSNSRRLENGDPTPAASVRPPVQIHIHQCPACEQATVQTSKGEKPISAAELEQARCDCQISEPGKRNTTSIPPKTRRLVLARDRHRCQRPGCHHTRHLELHHVLPRSKGGSNEAENLITLCSACHRLLHERPGAADQFLVREAGPRYGGGVIPDRPPAAPHSWAHRQSGRPFP